MIGNLKEAMVGEMKKLMVKAGLGLMVIMILTAGGFWIKALKADLRREQTINEQLSAAAAEAAQKLQAAKAETAGLARELEKSHRALLDREAEKKRLLAEKEAQQADMCEVYKNDQTANAWVNASVPGGVVGRLCRRPVPVPAGQAAPGGLPSGCARASVKNGDLVNWILDLQEALRQSNSDKAALRDWVASIITPAEP